jgi:hypothetical protein
LQKLSQKGFRGYPVATIALYGPTAEVATKVAVGIARAEGLGIDPLRRWTVEEGDIRGNLKVEAEMLAFIREHEVRTVTAADRIIGCPHEEGIDYPDGEKCPKCPFWASRDRFTHETIQ